MAMTTRTRNTRRPDTATPHHFDTNPIDSFWPSLSSLNKRSVARLRRCLLDPETTLSKEYPAYTEETPHVPLNLTDVQDELGEDTRPCSLTSTKVVLGNWCVLIVTGLVRR